MSAEKQKWGLEEGDEEEQGAEALIRGLLLSHRAPEVAIQQVNVCYTAKADLAEYKVPSGEKGVKVTPRFNN